MGKINWGRVFLGGLLVGVVGGVLDAIMVPLVARDFLAALPPSDHIFPPKSAGSFAFLGMTVFVYGIWTMWLYAAIRPRYGPGPKTAAVAGFALWVIGTLADVSWGSMGFVPPWAFVGPVAASLPICIVAAMVGAWLYRE